MPACGQNSPTRGEQTVKFMALDGNSIINRAFYGVRLLSTKDGVYTNAVFGFLNIFRKLMDEEKPDSVCVAFDLKAPTFRHKQYAQYKAQRKPMPEELRMQIPLLKDVLDAMNVRRCELEGYEADDLIGTMSAACADKGWECVIVTGDKDSFQLISGTTRVKHVKSRMGQTETVDYTVPVFEAEYGFAPEKIVDLKALMGDSSDNIPGVAGVGEKTALELVRRFGSLEAIYRDLDTLEIRDSLRKKLAAGVDDARMSYELATICRTAPIDFDPERNRVQPVDNDRLYALFQRLEFARLTERFGLHRPEKTQAPASAPVPQAEIVRVADEKTCAAALAALREAPSAAIRPDAEFSCLAAALPGRTYFLCREETPDYDNALRTIFSAAVSKAGHEVKDLLRRLPPELGGMDGWNFDAALAAYLLEPTDSAYGLDFLSRRYLGRALKEENADGQMSILDEQEDPGQALCAEAQAILALEDVLAPKLSALGMTALLQEIELPLCPVLARMEQTGFLVDRQALEEFGKVLNIREKELQQQIYDYAGMEFNVNSPKQLGAVLFEKLMLPAPKKTKTGYSTNVDVLEKLRPKHPVIGLILEYRELSKLRSTYADGLQRFIGPDGRIHTTFQMTVTATGRLSSTEPNLQNIPVRRALGGEIRKMFTARAGWTLVDADYSQIELRLLAHISGDETMRQAFVDGEDIHRVTASQVFDVPFDQVTSLQRSRAKAVNFGIVYGISKFSLAQDIGVSVAEAGQYMDSYLARYHGVRDYMHAVVERARADGYVSTLYGRRRSLPELQSSNYNIRSFGERVALNMPVQGTAADIMKIAMIRADRRLREEKLQARLLLQVHDELIAECPPEEAETVKRLLCEEMERAAELSVPLTAEAGSGRTWYDAK